MRRTGYFLLALTLAGAQASSTRADEVEDVLALKARTTGKLRRFAADFTVETSQPSSLRGKNVRMKYRMSLERLPLSSGDISSMGWRMEMTLQEPVGLTVRVEGERVSTRGPEGEWTEIQAPPGLVEQLRGAAAAFMGPTLAEQRRHAVFRVTGRHAPWFGVRTVTLETVPTDRQKLFGRMEEDITDDGLALVTRLFDASNHKTMTARATRHRVIHGVPIAEAMETFSQTPLGEVVSVTTCDHIEVETEP